MKRIGSQTRETLTEARSVLIKMRGNEAIIMDDCGSIELYVMHDHHAGYTLEIDGVGYEFCRSLTNQEAFEFINGGAQ